MVWDRHHQQTRSECCQNNESGAASSCNRQLSDEEFHGPNHRQELERELRVYRLVTHHAQEQRKVQDSREGRDLLAASVINLPEHVRGEEDQPVTEKKSGT